MKNKEFREIQVSSTLLVVIFLGVLALGVFIFLLGISVGKTQAGIAAAPTQVVTQQIPDPVKEPPVKPTVEETEDAAAAPPSGPVPSPGTEAAKTPAEEPASRPASSTAAVKTPAPKTPTEAKKSAAPAAKGLWYVQVMSSESRTKAEAAADRYRKQGQTVLLLSPQAGEKLYKVRLGGFSAKDRAVELKNRLNAAAGGKTDYWVVKY
jgi:cell division septation protein DedD